MANEINKPLLSVVIPVYKTEKYLRECVESVLGQRYGNVEVILVDDSSPDSAPEMCDAFAREDSRVKVIHKPNQGLGFARNSGIEVATGKYITFIDSDDTIHPDTYLTSVEMLEAENLDQVRFTCRRFTDKGLTTPVSYNEPARYFSGQEDMRHLGLCIFGTPLPGDDKFNLGGSSCMAVYRLDTIQKHGIRFESERVYVSEDYLFSLHYYLASSKIAFLNRTYYNYRVNPESLTHRLDPQFMLKVAVFSRHVADELLKEGFTEAELVYARAYYLSRQRVAIKFAFNSNATLAEKRKWFAEQTNSDYMLRECADNSVGTLPFKHRIIFEAVKKGRFLFCYSIIKALSMLRPDDLK